MKDMCCQIIISLAFLVMQHAGFIHCQDIYIMPSLDIPCPQDPCLTLSQFADDYIGNDINVSLIFLPGNHSLNWEFYVTRMNNLSMTRYVLSDEAVFIECVNNFGRFNVNETIFVLVSGLHFVGCAGNRVSNVEKITIEDTTFQGVEGSGTALLLTKVAAVNIENSEFLFNGKNDTNGGVFVVSSSNISVVNCKFMYNVAQSAGVMDVYNSSVCVMQSSFSHNIAVRFGGVMQTNKSSINIDSCSFTDNHAALSGGVINTYYQSSSNIITSSNSAKYDGVMSSEFNESSFNIVGNIFINNSAANEGGVIRLTVYSSQYSWFFVVINADSCRDIQCIDSPFSNDATRGGVLYTQSFTGSYFCITDNTFICNSADFGGVMYTFSSFGMFIFSIADNDFIDNTAHTSGGVMYAVCAKSGKLSFIIANNTFNNNSANWGGIIYKSNTELSTSIDSVSIEICFIKSYAYRGGVMFIESATIFITGSNFIDNSAASAGGVFWISQASFWIMGDNFATNEAEYFGGIMVTVESFIQIADCKFYCNSGSFYTFNSYIHISGHTHFETCIEMSILNIEFNGKREEGGAITSFQSTIIISGNSSFVNNQAIYGGALLATASTIKIYGEITLAHNNATKFEYKGSGNGGGICLQQSNLEIRGSCNVSNNHAVRGGGIYATGSTISVYQSGILRLMNNSAIEGGGIYLAVNPRMYLFKRYFGSPKIFLEFKGNHANYGGAMYVADDTNSGACSPNIECFIQTFAIYHNKDLVSFTLYVAMLFSENTASKQGQNLFGGLMDRCILPVQVCFCTSEGKPDCSYQPPPINVKKGETFVISVVAVDQVNCSVAANIISSLSSSYGGFGEGQQTQAVKSNYTDLTYNVFSPQDGEVVNIFADGPCSSSTFSIQKFYINFSDCICPVGFMPSNKNSTRCECICNAALSDYVANCDSATNLLTVDTNSWITYIDESDNDPPGYVIHPNCPFDYCRAVTTTINLNIPNGADARCVNGRRGVLCGACQEHLSLSLGSSRCLPCRSDWPAVFVGILLASIIAGVLLVAALLALNMTVAVGLINGFIFYANIIAANRSIFFPSSEPSFPTVFVAWLNLDIGIDACFFNTLDAYIKTWLQLAFSIYVISLVVLVIIVSEYSPKFAALIGKRDPVATLATLFLLSYAKMLSITITALSFATLHYPDGEQIIWLPDGTVPYFKGKHAGLATMALLIIIIIGIPYTLLLFLWQWLVRAPR